MAIRCTRTIPPPFPFPPPRCPSRSASTCPCGVGADKRFSIDPGGLFRADDFVSGWVCQSSYVGCKPGTDAAIQLPLPPPPFRAAWWQPTLLILVAWVRLVWNVEHGADYDCDFCLLPFSAPCAALDLLDRTTLTPNAFGCNSTFYETTLFE